jgi:hypothetical protein
MFAAKTQAIVTEAEHALASFGDATTNRTAPYLNFQ